MLRNFEIFSPDRHLEDFFNKKVAVHTPTHELSQQFLEYLNNFTDVTWGSGHIPTANDFYDEYKSELTYSCYFSRKQLTYGSVDRHIEGNKKIVIFKGLD